MAFTPYKPPLSSKFVDLFILTSMRHVIKKIIFKADIALTYSKKDVMATSIRCLNCLRLCRYTFNNVLYNCNFCKQRTT